MSWTMVSLAQASPQPWRNGGGITRELLAWPVASEWQVRLSVADVQAPGPFSSFPGIERWFAVLEGDGVILEVDGAEYRLTPVDAPSHFNGDASVHCRMLGGPTRDFNLMAAPGRGRMQRVAGALRVEPGGPALLALYAHAAPARMVWPGEELTVPAGHLGWCVVANHEAMQLQARDALWIKVDV